jgi:hypothetical protein
MVTVPQPGERVINDQLGGKYKIKTTSVYCDCIRISKKKKFVFHIAEVSYLPYLSLSRILVII